MKLGYARVDSISIDLEKQVDSSLADVDVVFVDDAKGAITRTGFREMLEAAHPGDCVVVEGIDQLADSFLELRLVLVSLERRRLKLTSISDRIDNLSPAQIFPAFQAIANFKQALNGLHDYPGLAAARQTGRRGGRRPVLTADKKRILDQLLRESHDLRSHARAVGVSVRTVRRYANGQYAK